MSDVQLDRELDELRQENASLRWDADYFANERDNWQTTATTLRAENTRLAAEVEALARNLARALHERNVAIAENTRLERVLRDVLYHALGECQQPNGRGGIVGGHTVETCRALIRERVYGEWKEPGSLLEKLALPTSDKSANRQPASKQ